MSFSFLRSLHLMVLWFEGLVVLRSGTYLVWYVYLFSTNNVMRDA